MCHRFAAICRRPVAIPGGKEREIADPPLENRGASVTRVRNDKRGRHCCRPRSRRRLVPGGTHTPKHVALWQSRRARASGARAGNRFRRAGRSGPRARGSLSFTATTRRFRSLHIRSGLAISAVPAIHEGLRFTRLFPSGSVGAEAPRFPGTCGLRPVRLAPPFAPTSRDRMIRPNRNEPLAASAVRLDQTRRFVRDVFSDATAGSATVPDGFNGIPLSYQAFRPSSSDGFLRLPMT